jgi:hypothetical protein
VNEAPFEFCPLTVTTTGPEEAPDGTVTKIDASVELTMVADVPLNVTALLPGSGSKCSPDIVTKVPTIPEDGDNPVIPGPALTEKLVPLLGTPETVITTLPVVAPIGTGRTIVVPLQLVGVAVIPLNVTVLEPCVEPKFAPVIVIGSPAVPADGLRLVIVGVGRKVKLSPLLAIPAT